MLFLIHYFYLQSQEIYETINDGNTGVPTRKDRNKNTLPPIPNILHSDLENRIKERSKYLTTHTFSNDTFIKPRDNKPSELLCNAPYQGLDLTQSQGTALEDKRAKGGDDSAERNEIKSPYEIPPWMIED